MKWIKFSDMNPPVGMWVLVTTRKDVAILKWDKYYEEYDSGFISVYNDTWAQPREIYALDFWAPVSFMREHLPDAFEEDDLEPKDNWYLDNKDHPNIIKIKEITEELAAMTQDKWDEWFEYGGGSKVRYGHKKIQEVSNLYEQINKEI